ELVAAVAADERFEFYALGAHGAFLRHLFDRRAGRAGRHQRRDGPGTAVSGSRPEGAEGTGSRRAPTGAPPRRRRPSARVANRDGTSCWMSGARAGGTTGGVSRTPWRGRRRR